MQKGIAYGHVQLEEDRGGSALQRWTETIWIDKKKVVYIVRNTTEDKSN